MGGVCHVKGAMKIILHIFVTDKKQPTSLHVGVEGLWKKQALCFLTLKKNWLRKNQTKKYPTNRKNLTETEIDMDHNSYVRFYTFELLIVVPLHTFQTTQTFFEMGKMTSIVCHIVFYKKHIASVTCWSKWIIWYILHQNRSTVCAVDRYKQTYIHTYIDC